LIWIITINSPSSLAGRKEKPDRANNKRQNAKGPNRRKLSQGMKQKVERGRQRERGRKKQRETWHKRGTMQESEKYRVNWMLLD
jgi:hypothetical protein